MDRTSLWQLALSGAGKGGGGVESVSGTFTCPSSGDKYTLNLGKTFSAYLFVIEMDDASKTALMASEQSSSRAFAVFGIYPNRKVDTHIAEANVCIQRITPTTGETGAVANSTFTCSGTSIECPMAAMNYANFLYHDYTYKYYVVAIV